MNPLMRVQTWLKVILVFAVGSTVMFSASGIGTVAADENASMLQSTEQAPCCHKI